MKNNELLIDALNYNYKGSYNDFEIHIVNFVEDYMKSFSNSEYYFPTCTINSNIKAEGITIGTDKIILNKKIIKDLMEGKKTSLLTLFHELTHIQQSIQIENGIINPNIINYIKDKLLNEYQKSENTQFGINKNCLKSFYDLNYTCESREIDANLNSISLTIQFLEDNNIKYEEEKTIFKKYYDFYSRQKDKKRDLSNCITFNSYDLSLEDAFDVAIKYHPEWLERYPQLKTEYSMNDCIKSKTFCKIK